MNDNLLKSFFDRFSKDKEKLNRKFEELNKKLDNIDKKFEFFEEKMDVIDRKCKVIEDVFTRFNLGKLDNVGVYLSEIETAVNQYRTLIMEGKTVHNGEVYVLKVQFLKIRPIINWENNELLSSRFMEIEHKITELEERVSMVTA